MIHPLGVCPYCNEPLNFDDGADPDDPVSWHIDRGVRAPCPHVAAVSLNHPSFGVVRYDHPACTPSRPDLQLCAAPVQQLAKSEVPSQFRAVAIASPFPDQEWRGRVLWSLDPQAFAESVSDHLAHMRSVFLGMGGQGGPKAAPSA